jgi:hypothetical protein
VLAGEAALDLDLERDFEAARERVVILDPELARRLGVAASRERFLVRGTGGLDGKYVEHFADVFEAVLGAYDELFGFDEYSKLPGKKLRVRVHLEETIERPPHFAPQFEFHSEIDFPVVDAAAFTSPTKDGKFLFYGLCHELGHVVAMWGDPRNEEDHHAWAHYTGVAVVEHLAGDKARAKLLEGLDDARWRTLELARKEVKDKPPSLADRDGVMALLIAVHDIAGAKTIGAAIDALDAADKERRVNRVRYYGMKNFQDALVAAAPAGEARKKLQQLFD